MSPPSADSDGADCFCLGKAFKGFNAFQLVSHNLFSYILPQLKTPKNI